MTTNSTVFKATVIVILMAFMGTMMGPLPVYAQELRLPVPGTMMHLSQKFTPALLKGIIIHPQDALKFDFIVYRGDKLMSNDQKKVEYNKLLKYFLASLTIPDENQWVNLSPYEKDRIIKEDFGKTEMGRDLLAEDYILKQITASLIYPESHLGKKFWDKVYTKAQQQYGTNNIPVNTFNKVWIVPDDALVYEKGNAAYVISFHLKVMLEEDYVSMTKHSPTDLPSANQSVGASQVVREIILPQLEKEVNEGENFANLRQVFSGVILAAWFKRALKESILGKVYANKAKVKGIDQDPKNNEGIYQRYLKAYKKGVFNYIKEDIDKYTHETIPRKYFSGGLHVVTEAVQHPKEGTTYQLRRDMSGLPDGFDSVKMRVENSGVPTASSRAMTVSEARMTAVSIIKSMPSFQDQRLFIAKAKDLKTMDDIYNHLVELITHLSKVWDPREAPVVQLSQFMEKLFPFTEPGIGIEIRTPIEFNGRTLNNTVEDEIKKIELANQRGLADSMNLPVKGTVGKEYLWSGMGIRLGGQVVSDKRFRHAVLPKGWKKIPTDHPMYTSIVDDRGLVRASIFYSSIDGETFITFLGKAVSPVVYNIDNIYFTSETIVSVPTLKADSKEVVAHMKEMIDRTADLDRLYVLGKLFNAITILKEHINNPVSNILIDEFMQKLFARAQQFKPEISRKHFNKAVIPTFNGPSVILSETIYQRSVDINNDKFVLGLINDAEEKGTIKDVSPASPALESDQNGLITYYEQLKNQWHPGDVVRGLFENQPVYVTGFEDLRDMLRRYNTFYFKTDLERGLVKDPNVKWIPIRMEKFNVISRARGREVIELLKRKRIVREIYDTKIQVNDTIKDFDRLRDLIDGLGLNYDEYYALLGSAGDSAMMAFSELIRRGLSQNKMTQTDLARRLEVNSSLVSRWASGKSLPATREKVEAIIEAFGWEGKNQGAKLLNAFLGSNSDQGVEEALPLNAIGKILAEAHKPVDDYELSSYFDKLEDEGIKRTDVQEITELFQTTYLVQIRLPFKEDQKLLDLRKGDHQEIALAKRFNYLKKRIAGLIHAGIFDVKALRKAITQETIDYYVRLNNFRDESSGNILTALRSNGIIDNSNKLTSDQAMSPTGGIDFNSTNLAMVIKRDGKGVPLPLAQQDMAQLSLLQGLKPVILEIRPTTDSVLFSTLTQRS